MVAQKVTTGVYKGVTTSELDELAAETAASLTATHPDYALVRGSHSLILHIHPILLTFPPFPTLAVGCPHCSLQPPQKHHEVLQ